MKHITSMILTLAMLASLAMVSCNKNTQEPANTADTTTPAVTTEAAITTAETDADIDITSLLNGMPVYDIHYSSDTSLKEFEDVCNKKMEEYTKDDSELLFACRFIEYPDIAIIGQVKSDESGNKYRGINGVIWKGERYDTPKYDGGPAFNAYITDDFIAIDSTGDFTGMSYFIYEGGTEYHTYPDDLNNSWPSFAMKDGRMTYTCISDQYAVASNQVFADFYLNYNGHDDYYGSEGVVQLSNGKIEYVENSSYSLEEWYADYPFKENYGDTLDEFLESIRVLYNLKIEDLGKNWNIDK